MLKKVCLVLLSSYCILAASYIASSKSKIVQINSYPDDETVIFSIENPIAECGGYFFLKSDIGFDANLSMLLSTYHSKSKLIVHGNPNILWEGSSHKYCKVYSLEYLQ